MLILTLEAKNMVGNLLSRCPSILLTHQHGPKQINKQIHKQMQPTGPLPLKGYPTITHRHRYTHAHTHTHITSTRTSLSSPNSINEETGN